MRRWTFLALSLLSVLALRALRAADFEPEFDAILEDKDKVFKTEMEQMGEGDKREFSVVTDDDIGTLEVGDIYKSSGTFFRVTHIGSKGASGGRFTAQRTAGRFEPGRSWSRVSGHGPVTIVTRETLFSLYLSGGFVMHPIAFILLVGIILTLNSFWVYRHRKQCPPRFVEASRRALEKGDLSQFEGLALGERGLFPAICRAMMVDFHTSTLDDIKSRCESRALEQLTLLRMPLKVLNFSAVVAPLLGLLGTVLGLVICFESLQYEAASAAKSQLLAAGVRVALFTTVAGLCVAIPVLCVYFFFNQKLNLIATRCEGLGTEFVQQLGILKRMGAAGRRPTPAKPSAPPRTEPMPSEPEDPDAPAAEEQA